MIYRVKKQKNAMDTYVLYDVNRMPQASYAEDRGDFMEFESPIEKAVFFTKVFIPGFGGALLFADNCKEGYPPDGEPIDFYYEAARSRLHALEVFKEGVTAAYGYIPAKAEERLDKVRKMLAAGAVPETVSLEALCELLWAGEEMVSFEAKSKIARNGLRDDFMVGCSTKGFTESTPEWKQYFSDLFNCVCVPTHWGIVEPERGDKHYDVLDEMIKWSKEQGMIVRGHALVWFSPNWECNTWIEKLSYEEVKKLVLERVDFLTTEYKDYFDLVDFNEPIQANAKNMTFDEHFAIMKEAYAIVRRNVPNCRLMLNFFNEWQELYGLNRSDLNRIQKDYGQIKSIQPRDNEWCVTVYEYLDRCVAEGMDFDCIGIQWHDHPYDLFSSREIIKNWYSRYHMPIHLTELEVSSSDAPASKVMFGRPFPATNLYWHDTWNEEIQSEWFQSFLELMYSLDEVKEFSTFSFCDAPKQWGSYTEQYPSAKRFQVGALAYAGLLDEDEKPKPAYYGLKYAMKHLGIEKHPMK
ncbi:putative glycosyl hydrolase family 10 [Clostridiales bacterium 1_7_47FAA]|uniref:endo-1,4-beta-xylanase n=1 Tax=Enterocloster hominis (ex Hitch et al. 2024) TaxID=1917870 RepID=A0ABV1DDB3_9FIRM|nr:putative glycosyl hydrolase family 10 [Clostridiales bacterium 1_7_47FAA]